MPKKAQWGGHRDGAGRPRKLEGNKSVALNLFIANRMRKQLERKAKKKGLSMSDAIRQAIDQWLEGR